MIILYHYTKHSCPNDLKQHINIPYYIKKQRKTHLQSKMFRVMNRGETPYNKKINTLKDYLETRSESDHKKGFFFRQKPCRSRYGVTMWSEHQVTAWK